MVVLFAPILLSYNMHSHNRVYTYTHVHMHIRSTPIIVAGTNSSTRLLEEAPEHIRAQYREGFGSGTGKQLKRIAEV